MPFLVMKTFERQQITSFPPKARDGMPEGISQSSGASTEG